MEPKTFEEALEQAYPFIEWRKALKIAAPQGQGYACRFCIARHGLRAPDVPDLPQTIREFHEHMKAFHPVTDVSDVPKKEENIPPDPTASSSATSSKSQAKRINTQKTSESEK